MSRFIHVATFTTGMSRNLTDLALARFGDRLMLYGVTHVGSGLSVWSIGAADGPPVLTGTYSYPG